MPLPPGIINHGKSPGKSSKNTEHGRKIKMLEDYHHSKQKARQGESSHKILSGQLQMIKPAAKFPKKTSFPGKFRYIIERE
ncbi:MAG: hypothetical protein DRH04_08540 [Deltaproteobacteria bacterium]|nr:MAG: hypothetical protein DRH04_08540 [Deltaproteobacteria bacterium]